jgi:uncharacterized protein involved in outer membrane biogenesis
VIVVFIGLAVVLGFVYREEVNNLIINELNKKIVAKIDVEEVKFSLLRKFPNASVEFRDILIHPPKSFVERQNTAHGKELPGFDTLLFARHLFLEFNIKDLLNRNFQIKKLHAGKGTIFMKVDNQGNPNYQFWKKENDSTSTNLEIQLKDLKFTDLNLNIINQVSQFRLHGFTEILRLNGNFSQETFQLKAGSELLVRQLSQEGIKYLMNKTCRIEMEITTKEDRYTLDMGRIEISGIPMAVNGSFTTGEAKDLNLEIIGDKLNLQKILPEIPLKFRKKLEKYRISGNMTLKLKLNGGYGILGPPLVDADISIGQSTILPVDGDIKIENLSLAGHFTNGKRRNKSSTRLDINSYSFQIRNSEMAGSCWIEDLNRPRIEILANGSLDMSEVYQFLQPDSIEFLQGQIRANIKFAGEIRDYRKITKRDIQNLQPIGQATLKKVGIKLKNDTKIFTDIDGTLMFGNHIWVDDLSLNLNGNVFRLKGKLGNAVQYIMTRDKPLLIDADVKSEEFVLDRFRFYSSALEDTLNITEGIHFPDNLQMNLRLEVDKYSHGKFNAENLSGFLSYQPGIIAFQSLRFETMEGQVRGDGMMKKTREGEYPVHIRSDLIHINIKELFASFENFGQKFILDENLEGAVSGDIEFSATWSPELKIKNKTITAVSHLTIDQGELIDFEPMMGLSKFIEIEELKHIKFSQLKNEILIKDRIITIPKMDIQSSALNVTLSGVHDFENNISYKSKVLLSELIFRKAKNRKKENEEFGVIEDDGRGRTSLYFTITGRPGDIKIAYDRKEVKQALSESMQEEKKLLKEILKEEFGWFNKDTTAIIQKEDSVKTGFIIQWDDTDTTMHSQTDTLKAPAFRVEWDDDETKVDTIGTEWHF